MNYHLVDDGYTEEEIEVQIARYCQFSIAGAIFAVLCPALITAIVSLYFANKAAYLIEHYEVGQAFEKRVSLLQYFGYAMVLIHLVLLVLTFRMMV